MRIVRIALLVVTISALTFGCSRKHRCAIENSDEASKFAINNTPLNTLDKNMKDMKIISVDERYFNPLGYYIVSFDYYVKGKSFSAMVYTDCSMHWTALEVELR